MKKMKMKKMNKIFCALMMALPMMVSNLAQAASDHDTNGTGGWALSYGILPPNPGYPVEHGPGFGGPFYRDSHTVICGSISYQQNHCDVDGSIHSVRIIRQHSKSPCTLGHTWGWRDGSIWVSKGCRATFHVEFRAGSSGARES